MNPVAIAAIEKVWTACQKDDRLRKNGVDHIMYRLTDEIVASYMPVVEEIDEAVAFADASPEPPAEWLLTDIFKENA